MDKEFFDMVQNDKLKYLMITPESDNDKMFVTDTKILSNPTEILEFPIKPMN